MTRRAMICKRRNTRREGSMNQALLTFFEQHYAPGRVGLIGQDDLKGTLIRGAEAGLTPDHRPSKWSHTFLMGERRRDGNVYIFESDLRVSVKEDRKSTRLNSSH